MIIIIVCLFCCVLILNIYCNFVPKRYESVKFKDFSGGQGQKIFKKESQFAESLTTVLNKDTDDFEIAPAVVTDTIINSQSIVPYHICEFDGSVYMVVHNDTTGYIDILRSYNFAEFTVWKTIELDAEVHHIFSAWGRLNITFSASGTGHFFDLRYYDSTSGTFIQVDLPVLGTNETSAPKMPVVFLDGYYYYITQGLLWKSSDGNNFTQVFDFHLDMDLKVADDSFLYGVLNEDDFSSFVRIYFDGSYDVLKSFNPASAIDVSKYNDGFLVSEVIGGVCRLHYFDGNTFRVFNTIDDEYCINVKSFGFADRVVLVLDIGPASPAIVYFVYNNESVFRVFDLTVEYADAFTVIYHKSTFYVSASNDVSTQVKYLSKTVLNTSCSIISSIVRPTTMIPKALILRHSPLSGASEDEATVDIYVKKDGASSWGSAVIESETLDSLRKDYIFPTNIGKLEQIQFKIVKNKSAGNLQTDYVSLEYLYTPAGLSNSN